MLGKDVEDGFGRHLRQRSWYDAAKCVAMLVVFAGDAVTGSATYTGGAAGKWAIASTTEDTTERRALHRNGDPRGGFRCQPWCADAGANLGVSVSGTITNFMTGDVSRPNWNVTLTYDAIRTRRCHHTPTPPLYGCATSDSLPPMITGMEPTKWLIKTGGAVDGTGDMGAPSMALRRFYDPPDGRCRRIRC